MRPTFRQLEYLVAVDETGRFSAAAQSLHVSQPSLSAQIAEAESHLGFKVFERGRHGAIATPLGRELLERARAVLTSMSDIKRLAQYGQDGLIGQVRLGVLPTIGPYLLPRCTAQLHARYPRLRLSIREESSVDLNQTLTEGRMDIVISVPEDHPGCASAPLFHERLWAAFPPDDPLAQKSGPVTLEELSGRAFLTLGLGHRLNRLVADLAERADGHLPADYEGTSLDAIRHMSALGAGIAVLPELYVRCEAERDNSLVFRLIDDPGAQRDIALIWRHNSPLASGFQAIADILETAAAHVLDVANPDADPGAGRKKGRPAPLNQAFTSKA
ncbi:MAG: hydrogen peroxide-inducible genes activator [Alphaproteobacteria bacterium]|uniref:hydrogen peroxide-inducible genes activator n=1 Tax=Maricaulis alexandrii TaxID=2570354 RepID=UPI0011099360|nr:hydrogen peroxide-inducible genes activator [Maricaulis alexandrii]MCR9268186.1 hydrogen peroxide-inducible genes activator [Alphaproteobacteria bacterium]